MSNQQEHPPQAQQQMVVRDRQPIAIGSQVNALVPTDLDGAWRLAQWLSKSSLIPKYKDKEADIFLIITTGMELGLPPNASLRGLYCVNGRVALESKTKAALCISKGAAMYFKRIEYTPEATTWETLRAGQTEVVRSRYTKKEAAEAGLTKKEGPWQNYPQRMISHRALGWLCDDVYPDIVLGVSTAEDFDELQSQTFREIGGGMSLSFSDPPAASTPQAASTPSAGVPTTAKNANPTTPTQPAPPPKAEDLTEEEILSISADMKKTMDKKVLRDIGAKRIHGRAMSDRTRNRLLEVYEGQVDLIDSAERDVEPTKKDS